MLFDISPKLFCHLCSGHRSFTNNCSEFWCEFHGLHKFGSFFFCHLLLLNENEILVIATQRPSYNLLVTSRNSVTRVRFSSNDKLYLYWGFIVKKNRLSGQDFWVYPPKKALGLQFSFDLCDLRIHMETISLQHSSAAEELSLLAMQLKSAESTKEKLTVLDENSKVKEFFSKSGELQTRFTKSSEKEGLILLQLVALGQEEHLFPGSGVWPDPEFSELLSALILVEDFYQEMGGIVGYHLLCLQLLAQKKKKKRSGTYHLPKAVEIGERAPHVRSSMLTGIAKLESLAEVYPIGGAADRLSLRNEKGEFLTAATLEFCGRTLVQRLIDDLQGREYLHFKLYGKSLRTPVVMMTSEEKNNDSQVRAIFRANNWFGRREEDFFLFSQPLVPAMNTDGKWCVAGESKLFFKPGGHGVIWKLMKEKNVLSWLREKGVQKVLTRQINNMIAGVDMGLLAFLGIGFAGDKKFGFASCPHTPKVQEGINVVIQNEQGCCLTNIEYCDFDQFEIDEKEEISFLSNTNLLFVDLETIEDLVAKNPIPGMLVNAKTIQVPDGLGGVREENILRLESTMQNLADSLIEVVSDPSEIKESFITSNPRGKTISTIKKEYSFGGTLSQTPEQAFLDMQKNGHELLTEFCSMQVTLPADASHFFFDGPSFHFQYCPALGPCFSVIGQKLRGGRLARGAELHLWIADLFAENLDVDGALRVVTDSTMGHIDEDGVIQYSHQTGKCTLKNVTVRNSGVNREASGSFWKSEIVYKEKCEILIEEGGEFYAEDVVFRGDHRIRVPSGVKVVASMRGGRLELSQEVLAQASWYWEYSVNERDEIQLSLIRT